MNVKTAVARRGFEIYCEAPSMIDLDTLNEILAVEGTPPISARTFDHYRRMYRNGIRHYLPINRFDVWRAERDG